MRNLLNPKWLFIVNTLPIIILFVLFYGEYTVIQSLLTEEGRQLWLTFGTTLGILGLLNIGYAAFLIIQKRSVSFWYAIFCLVSCITFIYLYFSHLEEIIPWDIPRWMVADNIELYVGTFLMPTLIYSLLVLVVYATPETQPHSSWKSFLIAFLIPVGCYLFGVVIFPLWRQTDFEFNLHVYMILVIIATLLFLFFLVRGFLILVKKKGTSWKKYELIWKIPIAIVFPLVGLLLNNGGLEDGFLFYSEGIFGEFRNHWFYILAVLNGILICLPDLKNTSYRLALFVSRSILFAYTLYFFLVFLPFLPISLYAVVLFGSGFLMLTPLVLFVIHVNELSKDFRYLQGSFSKHWLRLFLSLGIAVIPTLITVQNFRDKYTLNEALNYVYNPDYSKTYAINKPALSKVFGRIESNKDNNRREDFIMTGQQPYLSAYYNWIVFEHLTLSESKINYLKRIFFGAEKEPSSARESFRNQIGISQISTDCIYDATQQAWKSWIHLEIANGDTGWQNEYATTFDLPEGCWISDYYLYVGDQKEMGILAEKKSAMWVYNNIVNVRRDPGILYYLTGNRVAFKVFPFASSEVRKTGIEFLHKEPVEILIDGNTVVLGEKKDAPTQSFENDYLAYVSVDEKAQLQKTYRKPYFHFILDVTHPDDLPILCNRIEQVASQNKALAGQAKISLVESFVSTYSYDSDWKQKLSQSDTTGGFYLERAIKSVLFDAYQPQSDQYPVIVVATNHFYDAVVENDFADWSFAYPENNRFYVLRDQGFLVSHPMDSAIDDPVVDSLAIDTQFPVLAYIKNGKTFYLADNSKPGMVIKPNQVLASSNEIKEKDWESALQMQGQWMSQILYPTVSDTAWLNLVKNSFTARVMAPVTSFLVVENEAQKAILKKKQEQVLSGNKSLDLDDDTERMSEPGFIVLVLLLLALLWYKQNREQKKA